MSFFYCTVLDPAPRGPRGRIPLSHMPVCGVVCVSCCQKGKRGVKQIYPSVKSKKAPQWVPEGVAGNQAHINWEAKGNQVLVKRGQNKWRQNLWYSHITLQDYITDLFALFSHFPNTLLLMLFQTLYFSTLSSLHRLICFQFVSADTETKWTAFCE